jgi:hypothetical protein
MIMYLLEYKLIIIFLTPTIIRIQRDAIQPCTNFKTYSTGIFWSRKTVQGVSSYEGPLYIQVNTAYNTAAHQLTHP